eukprot:10704003-Alexandrium_andersonii.AAC.1
MLCAPPRGGTVSGRPALGAGECPPKPARPCRCSRNPALSAPPVRWKGARRRGRVGQGPLVDQSR